jgi:hypothetical protein
VAGFRHMTEKFRSPRREDIVRVRTCASCGRACPVTTYNRAYCSVRCRRAAGHAKERDEHRASRAAVWADFWAAHNDVPSAADVIAGDTRVLAAKSRR